MSDVMIWSWHLGVLEARHVDAERWVERFWQMDESDDCALDGVEIAGDWFHAETVRKMPEYLEREQRQRDQWKQQSVAQRELAYVELKHPIENDWAHYETVDRADAHAALTRAQETFGAQRVRLRGPWRLGSRTIVGQSPDVPQL